jgi:hypothetical protein
MKSIRDSQQHEFSDIKSILERINPTCSIYDNQINLAICHRPKHSRNITTFLTGAPKSPAVLNYTVHP